MQTASKRNRSGLADAAGLRRVGVRVEVKGTLAAGTLLASQVKLGDPKAEKQIELKGSVSALDNTAKTFVLRGVAVTYAGAVQYEKGGLADLRNGAKVEVKGRISSNSALVIATRIEFSD